MPDVVIIFSSVHHTLKAEGILKTTEFNFLVVPVPPFVNEGCGLGIKISKDRNEDILELLATAGISTLKTVELA